VIKFTVGKIVGFALANFAWQFITGRYDWEFAATVSFLQAWAIGFAVRDTYKLLRTDK
jgi:hypothetical protein